MNDADIVNTRTTPAPEASYFYGFRFAHNYRTVRFWYKSIFNHELVTANSNRNVEPIATTTLELSISQINQEPFQQFLNCKEILLVVLLLHTNQGHLAVLWKHISESGFESIPRLNPDRRGIPPFQS